MHIFFQMKMAADTALKVLLIVMQMTFTKGDYSCLCSYEVETKIFDAASDKGHVIGFMYEFDCKPTLNVTSRDKKYQPVGNEHQVCKA